MKDKQNYCIFYIFYFAGPSPHPRILHGRSDPGTPKTVQSSIVLTSYRGTYFLFFPLFFNTYLAADAENFDTVSYVRYPISVFRLRADPGSGEGQKLVLYGTVPI